jgi:glutaredoxin
MDSKITVYGLNDCADTLRVREYLATHGIHFEYTNLEQDKTAEQMVKDANDGHLRTPLVIVQFGTEARKLRAPSNEELADALRDVEVLDRAA